MIKSYYYDHITTQFHTAGFIDEGWQDTLLLLPGIRVQVAMRVKDYTGIYVYHCHNL